MAITVLNIKTDSLPDGYLYIGRDVGGFPDSPLQNPWRLVNEGDRQIILAKYKRHLWDWMRDFYSPIRAELFRLSRLAKNGDHYLACWCAPKSCHGDVIKAAIEWIIEKDIHEYDYIKAKM